jgi:hypothetical protein
VACGLSGSTAPDGPTGDATGRPVGDNDQNGGAASGDAATGDTGTAPDDNSVADVTTGGNGGAQDPSRPRPEESVEAHIRNESEFKADVTLRYIVGETVIHLAFVQVLPKTSTIIVSPTLPDRLELSGSDESGRVLANITLVFGVDFDADTPAEYVIPAKEVEEPPPEPEDPDPPTITMLEPGEDKTRLLGSTLLTRWEDTGDTPGTVVRILLRPTDTTSAADPVQVGPAVGAAFDGVNDQLLIVLEGIDPGLYEVVGEIDDGTRTDISVAPGRVRVVEGENAVPSLEILSPTQLTELHTGDVLLIRWEDEDEDDNAVIMFSLAETQASGVPVDPFVISPVLFENLDGDAADSIALTISEDVLAGLYDLVGEIKDGQAVGTARVEGIVRILEDPVVENDAPQLELHEPSSDIEVERGGSLRVEWTDSDENDNAQISLLLDPDLEGETLDGNEVLLVSSLDEDDDGPDGSITLQIPAVIEKGIYRLAGQITDGVVTVPAWAVGKILLGLAEPALEPPELNLSLPSADVKARPGGFVYVFLEAANVLDDADVRLYLSNVAHGGDFRGDVTPDQPILNQLTTARLLTSEGMIPNAAWPRRFDLQAELELDGVTYPSTAPGAVLIRQEVEVMSVDMVNYECPNAGDDAMEPIVDERRFFGLEISWRGGGFEEREPHSQVEFWLTGDGLVPDDGVQDNTHRIIHWAPESPNVVRTVQLFLVAVLGFPERGGEELRAALDRGRYRLVTVTRTESFGRITTPPFREEVEICLDFVLLER